MSGVLPTKALITYQTCMMLADALGELSAPGMRFQPGQAQRHLPVMYRQHQLTSLPSTPLL